MASDDAGDRSEGKKEKETRNIRCSVSTAVGCPCMLLEVRRLHGGGSVGVGVVERERRR